MQEQLQDAAVASTNIAAEVARLPQNPMLQNQIIVTMIQDMRTEFRARFIGLSCPPLLYS